MQFKIFKNQDIIQGISDTTFGSMVGKKGDRNVIRFLKSLGYKNFAGLIWAEQVFGSKVHICKKADSGKIITAVDGLISDTENQILAIVSADCVPILFFDPENRVVAALHGSRKSLIGGIVKKAIKKMVLNFNSNPKEILVGLGPHIRHCHYWLEKKTHQNLKNTKFKKYFISKNRKIYFNLTKLTFDDLLVSGIKRKNIEDCLICTFCQFKKYFSARKEKENPKIYYPSVAKGDELHSSSPSPLRGSVGGDEGKLWKRQTSSPEKNPRFAGFIGLKTPLVLKFSAEKSNFLIQKAIKSIKRGGVLVLPTDTVYGLIVDATNKKAVEKLFKIKRRNSKKPVPIFVRDIKMAKKLAVVNKEQEKFLTPHQKLRFGTGQEKVWPGKVTVVLKRRKGEKLYGVDKKTIGLRVPNYKFINVLLKKLNRPLTGTSANISGKLASTKIKEVISQFKNQPPTKNDGGQPDLIIDAGNLPKNRPSTVVDFSGEKIKILRK